MKGSYINVLYSMYIFLCIVASHLIWREAASPANIVVKGKNTVKGTKGSIMLELSWEPSPSMMMPLTPDDPGPALDLRMAQNKSNFSSHCLGYFMQYFHNHHSSSSKSCITEKLKYWVTGSLLESVSSRHNYLPSDFLMTLKCPFIRIE